MGGMKTVLDREVFHAERLMYVWMMVALCNCVSLSLAQIALAWLPSLRWQALLCLYLMWLVHSTPPCFLHVESQKAVASAHRALARPEKLGYTHHALFLGLAVLVGVGVCVPEAVHAKNAVIIAVAVKAAGTMTRHCMWLYTLQLSQECSRLCWTLRYTVVSLGTYLMALGVFYAQRSTWVPLTDPAATPAYQSQRLFMFGVCYPVARHVLRHCFAFLLNDPEGHRRTVRLYAIMSIDLPCYIMVYSHSDVTEVRMYVCLLVVIDTLYRLLSLQSRTFSLSQVLWIKLLAIGSVLTVWPSQEARDHYPVRAIDLLERLLYAVSYLVILSVLPHVLVTTWRAIPLPTCQRYCQTIESPVLENRHMLTTKSSPAPVRVRRVYSDTEDELDTNMVIHNTLRTQHAGGVHARKRRTRYPVKRRHPRDYAPVAFHARAHLLPVQPTRVYVYNHDHDPSSLAVTDVIGITLQLDSISFGMMAVAMLTTIEPTLVLERLV